MWDRGARAGERCQFFANARGIESYLTRICGVSGAVIPLLRRFSQSPTGSWEPVGKAVELQRSPGSAELQLGAGLQPGQAGAPTLPGSNDHGTSRATQENEVAATGRRAGARRSRGLVLPGGKVVAARPAAELELGVPGVWCSQYEPRSGAILGYFILSAPPNGAQSETLPCLNQAGSCSWSLSSGSRHHSVSAFPSPATRSKP